MSSLYLRSLSISKSVQTILFCESIIIKFAEARLNCGFYSKVPSITPVSEVMVEPYTILIWYGYDSTRIAAVFIDVQLIDKRHIHASAKICMFRKKNMMHNAPHVRKWELQIAQQAS